MSGIITALKIQKHCRNRVNVFIDDHFAFSLGIDLAADLARGQHLPQDRIDQLKQIDTREKAYQNALRFIASRPRSRKETFHYLKRRGYESDLISQVLDRLIHAKYIDDHQFACFWVENRERFRPRSVYALRHELRQKGVADTIINSLLVDLDEDQSAFRAARQNLHRWRRLDRDTFKKKLYGFLHRRGFGYETSRKVFHQVCALIEKEKE